MKVLFEPNRNYIVFKENEEDKKDDLLILDEKTKFHRDSQKSPFFEIIASHPMNDYKVGDKVCFKEGAAIGRAPIPTDEGIKDFLLTTEEFVIGKLIES